MIDRNKYNAIKWEDIVYYDESSPSCLRWKVSPSKKFKAGDEVGTKETKSFGFTYKNKQYRCHVVIWYLHAKLEDGFVIDHKNRNSFDNRIDNLRQVKSEVNMRNRNKMKSNTTGITGVYYGNYTRKILVKQEFYSAQWHENGKKKEKRFSVKTHGKDKALTLAINFRKRKIEELNLKGAEYSEFHGQ